MPVFLNEVKDLSKCNNGFWAYLDYADFGSCLRLRSGTAITAAQRTSASLISAPLNHRSISYFGSAQHNASTNLALAKHKTGFWKWPLN
jgi:hypothetical protein